MIGCHNCGALSGLDPRGTCNACGKPCDYSVALLQLEEATALLERAQHYVISHPWFEDYEAFLKASRAPAQPAAPEVATPRPKHEFPATPESGAPLGSDRMKSTAATDAAGSAPVSLGSEAHCCHDCPCQAQAGRCRQCRRWGCRRCRDTDQPTAPAASAWEDYCAAHMSPIPRPAAPEPSGDNPEADERHAQLVRVADKLRAAETRLAAVAKGLDALIEHLRTDYIAIIRTDDDSMCDALDTEQVEDDLKAILALLTAPSPVAERWEHSTQEDIGPPLADPRPGAGEETL